MTAPQRHTLPVDVHLLLRRDGDRGPEVLLSRRAGPVYATGMWHLPSGHLEADEDFVGAVIREAREETGILIDPADVRAVVTVHHRPPTGSSSRLGVFFEVRRWSGRPRVTEPDRCDGMGWYALDALPAPMVAYCRAGLDAYRAGLPAAVHFQRPGDPVEHRDGGAEPEPGPGRGPGRTGIPRGTVGSTQTRLVVVRGNSASGKSSVAAGIRDRFGRGVALVGQDNLRRIVLRERDVPRGASIGLIDTVARHALDAGYHVVVEGILHADRYGDMLLDLLGDHRGVSRCYYLDVPIEETLARHATKTDPGLLAQVSERELRTRYRERDLLPGGVETVVGAHSALGETVGRIMRDTGLAELPRRPD